ncbi:MAG: hypothetical protein ABI467_29910 [Kofleriaceae bacterium]
MITRLAVISCCVVGCASAEVVAPDAPPSTIPKTVAGTYDLVGTLDLATLPEPATYILAELANATDSPDDPARYLVDRMVAALPDGTFKSVATGLAPYIAPYIELELDRIAPNFAPGVHAIVAGLGAVAHHMVTIERLVVAPGGIATRALIGLQLANVPCQLAAGGAPDALAITRAEIDREGTLLLTSHTLQLPYGEMLRLGLDRAVIPSVDLAASDLAGTLRDLVDCHQLGLTFYAHANLGSASLYETACAVAMTSLASEVYDKIAAIDAAPFELDVSGTATGVDRDGDGTMDQIQAGAWVGTASYAGTKGPLGANTFTGTKE